MSNLAEDYTLFDVAAANDPAFKARVDMLRAAISAIPHDQRARAFASTRDLWPLEVIGKPKVPQRGGEVLNNVVRLFKLDPHAVRDASDVQAELEKQGSPAEAQSVRNALSYLSGRSVLRRVGYGKYQLQDGRIIEGLP